LGQGSPFYGVKDVAKLEESRDLMSTSDHITVCICTYKRPEMLKKLLTSLEGQKASPLYELSAVVVDNDQKRTGADVVHDLQSRASFHLDYDVEPEQSISLARNRAVKTAKGNLIAFIDDDEFPDQGWLRRLFETLKKSSADGVLGTVAPHFDNDPPRWLVRSGILERRTVETGILITNPTHTRTGNVLLSKDLFNDVEGHFDPRYGKTGGGDVDFFNRMMMKGRRFVSCKEAVVFETVPPERQKRIYYLKRAFTRGMTTAMYDPFFSWGSLKSVVAIGFYTVALPFTLFFGQGLFMRFLIKDCDHLGKILKYLGIEIVKNRPYAFVL
jgi:glycosyltransferase involved in cell wall biosynthesis